MSQLIASLETAFANLVQEVPKEASVLVQFAAGHWAQLKEAFAAEAETIKAGMAGAATTVTADLEAAKARIAELEAQVIALQTPAPTPPAQPEPTPEA